MQANMQTKVLTAHVPGVLVEKIDQIASRLDRSRTWILKQALTAWISQEEQRRQMTLDALSDVDAANFVDHQVMQNWADNLEKEE